MKNVQQIAIVFAGLFIVFLLINSVFIVDETEQVVITQFGEIQDEPITEPGMYFLIPFVQEANRLDRRFLEFDGRPEEVSTLEKSNITVDTYARWRISDPFLFFRRVRVESRPAEEFGLEEGANSKPAHYVVEKAFLD